MCGVLGPLPKGQNGARNKVGSLQVTEKRQTRSLAIPGPFPLFLDWCYLVAVPTCYAVCRGHSTAKSQSCEIRRILIIACRETFTHCCKKSTLLRISSVLKIISLLNFYLCCKNSTLLKILSLLELYLC